LLFILNVGGCNDVFLVNLRYYYMKDT